MKKMKDLKIIICGGGTGGHVFPAIAIADKIKEKQPNTEILFVGADKRMEMDKVPQAGYRIIGLPVVGLQRKLSLKLIKTLYLYRKSISMARKIVIENKPDAIVGVGGYASAPILKAANKFRIPYLIQEQNSYPGITNKMFAKNASAICVAYDDLDKFFPKEKIHFTGNPVRNLKKTDANKQVACEFFKLNPHKKVVLMTGGSLGARTLNVAFMKNYDKIAHSGVQFLVQTGKAYFKEVSEFFDKQNNKENVVITEFINRMDLAYKAADLVVSRAGAISISELALLEKAVIFVPSPNVAENHQDKNAQALVKINAALKIEDTKAVDLLIETALKTIADENKISELSGNIAKYAKPQATDEIVDILFKNIM